MKNQSSLVLIVLSIFLATTTSCNKEWGCVEGEGPIQTQTRSLEGFAGVDYQLHGRVSITPDSEFAIYVTTYQNYQPLIHMDVINGILVITSTKSLNDDDITIDIHMPQLNYINHSGSGKIFTAGNFVSPTMNIQLSGSGNIDFSGDVINLNSNVSGSGCISLVGSAHNSTMKISGSGKTKAYSMICENNTVTISGSGDVYTYVMNNLHVNISGSGSAHYMGSPELSTNISGSGRVIHEQ